MKERTTSNRAVTQPNRKQVCADVTYHPSSGEVIVRGDLALALQVLGKAHNRQPSELLVEAIAEKLDLQVAPTVATIDLPVETSRWLEDHARRIGTTPGRHIVDLLEQARARKGAR